MTVSGETKRTSPVPALLLALAFLLCYALAVAVLTPVRYDVIPGAAAAVTIEAPRILENEAATRDLREAARQAVKPVYRLDQTLIDTNTSGATAFFTDIASLRTQAEALRQARAATSGVSTSGMLTVQQWQQVVTNGELAQFLAKIKVTLTTDEGWQLLSAQESALTQLQNAVLVKLTASLKSGLEERALLTVKTAYLQELNALSVPDALKGVGKKVFDTYLQPTFVVDDAATAQAQEAAAQAVTPVQIKRGEVIVRKGDTVTEQQYELLTSLGLVKAAQPDAGLSVGLALYLLCVYGGFAVYLFLNRRNVAANRKSMLTLSCAMGAAMLLALAFNALDPRITTALLGVLLIALLLDEAAAMAANVALALSVSLFAGGRGRGPLGIRYACDGGLHAAGRADGYLHAAGLSKTRFHHHGGRRRRRRQRARDRRRLHHDGPYGGRYARRCGLGAGGRRSFQQFLWSACFHCGKTSLAWPPAHAWLSFLTPTIRF